MGFDEGVVVIKMGREEPAVSMDGTGKIVWAKYSYIETAIVKPAGIVIKCFFIDSRWGRSRWRSNSIIC